VSAQPLHDAVAADRFVHRVVRDWRVAGLSDMTAALCSYAEKLTLHPARCDEMDIHALRAAGLSDEAIHDAVQVVAYFNYINRVADGMGVTMEPGARIWGKGRGESD
jgi:uncharacterized peroxidase-related enzyme